MADIDTYTIIPLKGLPNDGRSIKGVVQFPSAYSSLTQVLASAIRSGAVEAHDGDEFIITRDPYAWRLKVSQKPVETPPLIVHYGIIPRTEV